MKRGWKRYIPGCFNRLWNGEILCRSSRRGGAPCVVEAVLVVVDLWSAPGWSGAGPLAWHSHLIPQCGTQPGLYGENLPRQHFVTDFETERCWKRSNEIVSCANIDCWCWGAGLTAVSPVSGFPDNRYPTHSPSDVSLTCLNLRILLHKGNLPLHLIFVEVLLHLRVPCKQF